MEEYQKLGYGLASQPNTALDPVESSCEKSDRIFIVGQRVRARFAGKAHFYNGKITADNGDGTFGIEYDDGDWEDELKAEYIQVISKKKKDALENLQNKEENQIHPEAQLVVDKAIIDVNPSIAADPESRKDTITAAHADAEKIVINALREVDAHISAQAHELVSHQPNGLSTTWDAGKIPSVENEQNIDMLATYAGDKNLGQMDENEESMRPKSRRGRAKPIKPTGRYPWQQEEHEDEMEDKVSTL